LEKDWQSAAKIGILKDDPAEVQIIGSEIIPRPPVGFRVLFLAFLLWGFSFPPRTPFCLWDSASRSESQHHLTHCVLYHAV
jgi:hypothetical protein